MTTTMSSVDPSLVEEIASTGSSALNSTGLGLDSAEDIQNRFLTLLMAQLKNQDPTKPMENSEITSQMAQLSTVSGISQLNNTMASLLGSLQTSQSMQAVNLIGKSVVVPGDAITLNSGSGQFGVYLDAPATNVKATITDAAGAVVNTIDLGSMPGGVSAIPWDGNTSDGTAAPDGQYTFTITAANGKTSVVATPLSVGLVTSVSTGAFGARLNIPTIGAVSFSNVLQIL